MSDYKVKYQLHFHTFNKTVKEKLEIANGTNFFDGEMNRNVYSEKDAVDYVRTLHKDGEIRKLYEVPEELYSSEWGDTGATS